MINLDILIVGGGIAGASLGAEVAAETPDADHRSGRALRLSRDGKVGCILPRKLRRPGRRKTGCGVARFPSCSPPDEFPNRGFCAPAARFICPADSGRKCLPGVNARKIGREELEQRIPGIKPDWVGLCSNPGCADIDVAALHSAYLRKFRRDGGELMTRARLVAGRRNGDQWVITLEDGSELSAAVIVDAAGAWADNVATNCGVSPLGIVPKRRTMVQLRVGRSGLKDLPLINDAAGNFYFKGESDRSIWLSPHDEIDCEPCDAAPTELDVATAIERFEGVVDWPVERVERTWAGLRTLRPTAFRSTASTAEARGFLVRGAGWLRHSDCSRRGAGGQLPPRRNCWGRKRRARVARGAHEYRLTPFSPLRFPCPSPSSADDVSAAVCRPPRRRGHRRGRFRGGRYGPSPSAIRSGAAPPPRATPATARRS